MKDSLLKGVDVERDDYYSADIGSELDLEWLNNASFAWVTAEKDADALELSTKDCICQVECRMQLFVESRIVFGRQDIYQLIENYLGENALLLLLGGENVGKSLILRDIQKRVNQRASLWMQSRHL